MAKFKQTSLFLLVFCFLILNGRQALGGGFGFSPGGVNNFDLLPGSQFEQEMFLLRADPIEDLKINIKIESPDYPEVKNWISLDKGTSFIIPKGTTQFPIKVIVDVPQKTKLGVYKGYLDVTTAQVKEEKGGGGVQIALGARINIVLGLTDRPISNFAVRTGEIPTIEYGSPLKYIIKLENTGNVKVRPSKVEIKIFDGSVITSLLKTLEIGPENLDWTKPYKTKEVTAEFPVELKIGGYWAETRVFKDETTVVRADKMFFAVNPVKRIMGLTIPTWIWIGIGFVILAGGARFWIWRIKRKKIGSNPKIGEEVQILNEEILEEKPSESEGSKSEEEKP